MTIEPIGDNGSRTHSSNNRGSPNDRFNAQGGDDKVYGEDGRDTLEGGSGNDQLWGGSGDDLLDGQIGRDEIHGGSGNDYIFGGLSDDLIYGNVGNDTIFGDSGSDTLSGGSGADHFYFRSNDVSPQGMDVISDFKNADTIHLQDGLYEIEKLADGLYHLTYYHWEDNLGFYSPHLISVHGDNPAGDIAIW